MLQHQSPRSLTLTHGEAESTSSFRAIAEALALRSAQARLRGDHALADALHDEAEQAYREERWAYELEAARRWVPGEKHQAIDRVALDHQRRRKALADFAEHERAMSKFCAISSSKAQNLDTGYPEVETAPVRRCGIWRMGRYRGTESLAYHLRCGRRGCVDCRPRVIAAKVAAVPAVDLYAIEVAAAQWPALAKRLSRARKGETAGEYVRIPRADDLVLVVSDAPIGRPIDRAVVADIMESTPTAHGYITASPAWRVRDAQVLDADDGFVDEGRMTSRPEWLRDVAERRLGRPVRWNRERGRMEFGETTDDEHHMLKFAGQVMSDDECRKAEQGFITGRRLAEQAMSGRRAAA